VVSVGASVVPEVVAPLVVLVVLVVPASGTDVEVVVRVPCVRVGCEPDVSVIERGVQPAVPTTAAMSSEVAAARRAGRGAITWGTVAR
jgi:hypothetical protein